MKFQSPRGTQDIIRSDIKKLEEIFATSLDLLDKYSYKQIVIPIFENTDLFKRSVGESTDIVNKEMYTFLDKSDRSITLRPEATAGIVRSYIQNGMNRDPKPIKLWTYGPMFRYERPQEGRTRQFHQLDVEVIGDSSIACEVESMFMISRLLNQLKIEHRFEINTLGDAKSKENYKEYFKKFTKGFLEDVCDDCKRRYEQNPLRMLDCKVKEDQEIYAGAKKPIEFLSEDSEKRWEEIKTAIGFYKEKKDINIALNPNLVRGLDYYNDFVFEIIAKSNKLNSNMAIGGGGRYDSLVENLGGESTPGYGFALGIERFLMLMEDIEDDSVKVSVLSDQPEVFALIKDVVDACQKSGHAISFDTIYNPKKIGKAVEQALKKGATHILFYFATEKEKSKVKIKNLEKREEVECSFEPRHILRNIISKVEA